MSNEASYIEKTQMENEESEESPSYADKAKKAVAGAVTIVYAVTQFGCAAISYHFSEEGKLHRELDKMTTWDEKYPVRILTANYNDLNSAVNKNKYTLDSLKVYQKSAQHLVNARKLVNEGHINSGLNELKRAQEVRRNPSSVLSKPRSKLTAKKSQASK